MKIILETSNGPVEVPVLKGDQGEQGPVGPTGPQGDPGDTGPKGDTGPTGPRGPQGFTGPMGPEGPQGIEGPIGDTGPVGPKGDMGPQGPRGVKGEDGTGVTILGSFDDASELPTENNNPGDSYMVQGDLYVWDGTQWKDVGQIQGPQGEQGLPGEDGAPGQKGAKGDTGPQGPAGPRGEQGPQGVQGDIGPAGPEGPKGDTGATGAKGATGAQGPQGIQGPKGDKGDTGPMGPQGEQGIQGPKGDKGDMPDVSQFVTLGTSQTISGYKTLNGKLMVGTNPNTSGNTQYAYGVTAKDASGANIQSNSLIWTDPAIAGETANGITFGFGLGANTIIGGGEAHRSLLANMEDLTTLPSVLKPKLKGSSEHIVAVADNDVYIGTNYQTGATNPGVGNWWRFGADGKFYAPDGSEVGSGDMSNVLTINDDQTVKSTKTWGEIITTGKGEEGQATSIAPDGSFSQVQKISGSNEYTEIGIAYGNMSVKRMTNDGVPAETALYTSHGAALSTDRGYTNMTVPTDWEVNYARVKTVNNVMIIHISGARPKATINGQTGGNIKIVAKLPQYFIDQLVGLDENVEFMWSNYGGGQLTFAGRVDVTGDVRLYIMPTSTQIVNGNRFSCYVPIHLK